MIADLKIHLRIPVTVVQNDDVSCVQVDTKTPSTSGQQEDELLAALCIVGINLCLSVLTRRVACTVLRCLLGRKDAHVSHVFCMHNAAAAC